ncbi:MAG: Na(+)-translocating NADH-quinone reductase subunit C [Cycloclasticus sp.]|jgi:Na+-transporting NADH:ubiquinone oxidoreductase subunit C|nr:MAG: NADH:ubiquinone reductase (Na(+)-transporting) subunit C [Cycloclasticus sp. Phe_18]MBV1913409.1 Na(+)-translocating NADH-quinone reductase subunit C [Cycloclasticus sp.]MDF1689525.1 Na(+)-translocating NADH-quinone reductase subunit C [Cycloclasticus sp.]MEE4290753.1 Na(+)-translocating NADH-quinone reductase subunit C [Cycloclasticus sp.]
MPNDNKKGSSMNFLALPNDSTAKTFIMATLVCLVCAIFVSVSAVALKPLQVLNKELDKKKNILQVAGLYHEGDDIEAAFSKIEIKLIDLETGEYSTELDAATYDEIKAAKDPQLNVKIPKENDLASIRMRPKLMPVYQVKEDDKVTQLILPVNGYGLWSTLYGFLAVENDGQTIVGLSYYQHAETPGLGGEVDNPKWKKIWSGKKIYGPDGDVAISVIKGTVVPGATGEEFQVDGLAGATLTSRGVSNMLKYWMGTQGYQNYLTKIQANGV